VASRFKKKKNSIYSIKTSQNQWIPTSLFRGKFKPT
jgi:hypothetical protein